MRHDAFLRDVLAAPARLDACLQAYAGSSPLAELGGPRRVVFTGMGSSRFAALPAAALLRSRGIDAVAEVASTALPTKPAADALAVGISASGSTPETVEALGRHAGVSRTVAGSREEVFTRLCAELDCLTAIAESAVQNRRTSVTPVRSYWRCNLDRGDKIAVAVEA